MDIFNAIMKEGKMTLSGLDGNYNPYRVFEFRGKMFKMTLVEVKYMKTHPRG